MNKPIDKLSKKDLYTDEDSMATYDKFIDEVKAMIEIDELIKASKDKTSRNT